MLKLERMVPGRNGGEILLVCIYGINDICADFVDVFSPDKVTGNPVGIEPLSEEQLCMSVSDYDENGRTGLLKLVSIGQIFKIANEAASIAYGLNRSSSPHAGLTGSKCLCANCNS